MRWLGILLSCRISTAVVVDGCDVGCRGGASLPGQAEDRHHRLGHEQAVRGSSAASGPGGQERLDRHSVGSDGRLLQGRRRPEQWPDCRRAAQAGFGRGSPCREARRRSGPAAAALADSRGRTSRPSGTHGARREHQGERVPGSDFQDGERHRGRRQVPHQAGRCLRPGGAGDRGGQAACRMPGSLRRPAGFLRRRHHDRRHPAAPGCGRAPQRELRSAPDRRGRRHRHVRLREPAAGRQGHAVRRRRPAHHHRVRDRLRGQEDLGGAAGSPARSGTRAS